MFRFAPGPSKACSRRQSACFSREGPTQGHLYATSLGAAAALLLGMAHTPIADAAASPVLAVPPSPAPAPLPQCLADLKAANVEFVDLKTVTKDGCTVEGAIELDGVASPFGKVALPARPIMSCLFARHFTAWLRDVAAPLSLAYTGAKLAAIETGPGFVCRTRYNRPDEKVSEHARGDAIDVTAFRFDNGRSLTVKEGSASQAIDGALMSALRTTACGYFTTVLGPGSNDAHKEHFHFDYGLHGQTANYRICE
jgi:hypothetical protein